MELKIGTVLRSKNNRLVVVTALHKYTFSKTFTQYNGRTGVQLKHLNGSNRKWILLDNYIEAAYTVATEREISIEGILYGS